MCLISSAKWSHLQNDFAYHKILIAQIDIFAVFVVVVALCMDAPIKEIRARFIRRCGPNLFYSLKFSLIRKQIYFTACMVIYHQPVSSGRISMDNLPCNILKFELISDFNPIYFARKRSISVHFLCNFNILDLAHRLTGSRPYRMCLLLHVLFLLRFIQKFHFMVR